MNETTAGGTAFRISIGLAFIGGYADASSFLLARTLTGHLTGNCVLAAVSAAGKDWVHEKPNYNNKAARQKSIIQHSSSKGETNVRHYSSN
jgi:hypothetical protein